VQISPRLNAYDLAAVQEDFFYHDDLISQAVHPFISVKDTRNAPLIEELGLDLGLGDGLNTFSFSPFQGFERVQWSQCFGDFTNIDPSAADCLATKGFTLARHEIEPGVWVDVYNLHADAGSGPEDLETRAANIRQLRDAILAMSPGRAVILLGDTNSRYTRASDGLQELLATTGLSDVWVELERAGDLPDPGPALGDCADAAGPNCERVDKIFFRSSAKVQITPLAYDVPTDWLDQDGLAPEDGEQLSDHLPVSALLEIEFVTEPALLVLLAPFLAALLRRNCNRM
jgi:endonuclease/exonuclease/phosphatase family metal-dependent hydrolase